MAKITMSFRFPWREQRWLEQEAKRRISTPSALVCRTVLRWIAGVKRRRNHV